MNEHEDIVSRLGALGQEPVDPDVTNRHLSAMTKLNGHQTVLHKLRVASAFGLGLLLGATGLASTGALPDPMQEIAHNTLGAVGVDVPRADRYRGEECKGEFKNHGEYVRNQLKGNRSTAAKMPCGKPIKGEGGTDGAKAGNGCGKPPWAGKGKPNQEQKAAAQAARKAACGDDDEAEDEAKDAGEAGDTNKGPSPSAGTSDSGSGSDTSSTTSTTLGDDKSTTSTTIGSTTTTTFDDNKNTTTTIGSTTTTILDDDTTTTTSSSSGSGSSGSGSSNSGSGS